MTVDGASADPYLLEAQAEAIREKRGCGQKAFQTTYDIPLLHSRGTSGKDYVYNRLVSTKDGHSEKWLHTEVYDECQWVCANRITSTRKSRKLVLQLCRVSDELKPWNMQTATRTHSWRTRSISGCESNRLRRGLKRRTRRTLKPPSSVLRMKVSLKRRRLRSTLALSSSASSAAMAMVAR